jgi:hypothetical protein
MYTNSETPARRPLFSPFRLCGVPADHHPDLVLACTSLPPAWPMQTHPGGPAAAWVWLDSTCSRYCRQCGVPLHPRDLRTSPAPLRYHAASLDLPEQSAMLFRCALRAPDGICVTGAQVAHMVSPPHTPRACAYIRLHRKGRWVGRVAMVIPPLAQVRGLSGRAPMSPTAVVPRPLYPVCPRPERTRRAHDPSPVHAPAHTASPDARAQLPPAVQQRRARSSCPLRLHTDLDRMPCAYAYADATAPRAPRLCHPCLSACPGRPRTTASRTVSRTHIACVAQLCSSRPLATACMNPPLWQDRCRGAATPSGPSAAHLLHVHALLTLRPPAILE